MLQSDWSISAISYEWGEYIKRSKGGENGAMLIGWSGDNGDPKGMRGFLSLIRRSGNWCRKRSTRLWMAWQAVRPGARSPFEAAPANQHRAVFAAFGTLDVLAPFVAGDLDRKSVV